jgi:hypothetical protein
MGSQYLDLTHPLRLERDGTVLGSLEVLYVDQPVFVCSFSPAPAYDTVRSSFEKDARISVQFERDVSPSAFDTLIQPVEASVARIKALGLRIVAANGWTEDFVLHIDGSRARLRYGDCIIMAEDAASDR